MKISNDCMKISSYCITCSETEKCAVVNAFDAGMIEGDAALRIFIR